MQDNLSKELTRRGGDQADQVGAEKNYQVMDDAGVSLESGNGAIRHPVRRALYETYDIKSDSRQ